MSRAASRRIVCVLLPHERVVYMSWVAPPAGWSVAASSYVRVSLGIIRVASLGSHLSCFLFQLSRVELDAGGPRWIESKQDIQLI